MNDNRHDPAFPLTVPRDFYNAVADVAGAPFADSYLWGADLYDGKLLPRTQIGWERISERTEVMDVLAKLKVTLVKPPLYRGPPAWRLLGYPDPDAEQPRKRRA